MEKSIKYNIVAIAMTSMAMTACSLDGYEPEKPFTVCPSEQTKFFACEANDADAVSRSVTASADTLFTEDDILWFNLSTREIRFRDMPEPLNKKLAKNYGKPLEFHLGENVLFTVSTYVSLWDSRVFTDLVLCYGNQESIEFDGYYLYDCYPLQWFINDERVQANIQKNATQWETFTKYLESKGKLRK